MSLRARARNGPEVVGGETGATELPSSRLTADYPKGYEARDLQGDQNHQRYGPSTDGGRAVFNGYNANQPVGSVRGMTQMGTGKETSLRKPPLKMK